MDWIDAGGKIERRDASEVLRTNQVPLIGTPGPTKNIRHNGHFLPLWNEAEARLEAADVIVFMGYRFPPSDSQARSSILRAIRTNQKQHVRVHTVLGPKTAEDDTVRLLKLLELTLQGGGRQKPGTNARLTYDLIAQPLYCEDFLTAIHNLELLGPFFKRD